MFHQSTEYLITGKLNEPKIPITEEKITADEVIYADEVFITNSCIEIVPVTQVNSNFIGLKKPGILTRFIHEEFLKCVEGNKNS